VKLSGKQREEFQNAMVSAFPKTISLEMMLKNKLSKNLEVIAKGNDQKEIIFKLINRAESEGWLEELVYKAHEHNPGNPELKQFVESFKEENARPDIPCPYRGLSAFREEDKDLFFGREKFVQQLVDAVKQHSLVPVIGASGSGKSSVVFAGLIPRLRAEGTWLIESFRPNKQPFYELAAALINQLEPELGKTDKNIKAKALAESIRQHGFTGDVSAILKDKPGKRLLLVADQFEELYSLCRDEKERQRFLDQLLSAVDLVSDQRIPSFSFVFTLRTDFYSYVLSYRGLVDAALGKFILPPLGPMTPQELQAAIEKPVEKFVELESGLTGRILEDVAAEPGNLPLLEFALTRLWQTQQNEKLTHAAYMEMGGVKQALAKQAEAIYSKLSLPEQEQAQRIFVQLVRPGEGTEDTRRLATRAEVGEENWDLVQELASARLVVTGRIGETGEETVEVVHEALIREWPSLQEWMKGDRTFRTWQEQLRAVMRQWENSGNDRGVLLRGFPLDEAKDWLERRLADMNKAEREFIRLSSELRQKEIEEQESQQQRITLARTTAICFGIVGFILIVLLNRQSLITAFITVNKKHLAESNLLKKFYLPRADLSEANLRQANLSEADLTEANLSGANLQGADLGKTYMPRANLLKADLSQANLSQTNIDEANLSEANLKGANFVKTFMPKAQLRNSDLSQANLLEANIDGADLSGANLQGAKNLNPDQVKRAKNWEKAKYDADFSKKLGLKGLK
jgi:uncharacterized protein YjbI with pentapeptide repeats